MKLSRRRMLRCTAASAVCLGLPAARLFSEDATAEKAPAGKSERLFPRDSIVFLHHMTRDVVQAARVKPGDKRGGSPANTTGSTLIMPGGNYPSYWIRDFAMSLESGFITAAEMLHHLRLTARCQNGAAARLLKKDLIIPPFAIPDHINFDGAPVFYPGTYSSKEDQGDGTFGFLPPVDDHYEFVHIAYSLYKTSKQAAFLDENIEGLTVLERLVRAFDAPRIDSATDMVFTDAKTRAVGFGFCDSIYFTGAMLFPSLLRYRAAGQLAELCHASGKTGTTQRFALSREKIARDLAATFGESSRIAGWLMAATGIGRQPDVWGTLYALHLGALRGANARKTRQTIAEAVQNGTICFEGAVRHVPVNLDASATSAWEKAMCAHNTYQNGAYWHTPTGWLIETLIPENPALARQVFDDYVLHLRKNDYRAESKNQAPWECFGRDGKAAQNGVYMTSVALPCSVLQRMS